MDLKIGVFMWFDNQIKEYADINYKINKIYCDKYGYTLIKSNIRKYPERKPHWERIPLILENFDKFDYLIWIDADAHFYIDSPPITNIINTYPDKLFIFSEDEDQLVKNVFNGELNSGVFIVKSCEESKLFLNEWGYNQELFIKWNGWKTWNDQAILRSLYDTNFLNIKNNSAIIKYGVMQYFKENNITNTEFGLNNNPFIIHLAGSNTKTRIEHSKKYYSNIFLNNYKSYINSNIQLAKSVISDILSNCENKKMLVFGLGYDSDLWYNATNKNTYFIENNKKYIELNKNIDSNNIIYHQYNNISVKSCLSLTNEQLNNFKIPEKILRFAPFDIILIDGPNGFDDNCPGRLLPIFWSKNYLSKIGTIIYVDDAIRNLEKKCINKYFIGNSKTYFKDRLGTMKIIL